MPFIDTSYFDGSSSLVVSGNEDAINKAIVDYEPEYLRAVLGQSLYEAFMTGIATPTGVYFSNQFSDQFFKGTIADRWKWIRDGHVFTCNGMKLRWPGLQNVEKKSPVANYVFSYYRGENLTVRTSNGDNVPTGTNMTPVGGPDDRIRRAWNSMAEWNDILYRMITTLKATDGTPLYPEFVRSELYCYKESVNVYNRMQLF